MSYRDWFRKTQGKPPLGNADQNIFDDSTVLQSQEIKLNDGCMVRAELWAEDGYTYLTYDFENENLLGSNDEVIMQYLSEQGLSVKSGKFSHYIMKTGKRIKLNLTLGKADE